MARSVSIHIQTLNYDGLTDSQIWYVASLDSSPESYTSQAVARVYRHLPEKEVHELLKHRFHILDLWRPISHAAYEWPLGFGDSSTVNPATELMEMTLEFPGGPGEPYGVEHNPNHKWKYLRGMEPDECVLFKWSVISRLPTGDTEFTHPGVFASALRKRKASPPSMHTPDLRVRPRQ